MTAEIDQVPAATRVLAHHYGLTPAEVVTRLVGDRQKVELAQVEWQVASGSSTAHVIDPAAPSWHNPDGSRRRSGPRSACGRYPQRNADGTWWALPVAETRRDTGRSYGIKFCDECAEHVTSPASEVRRG